MIFWVFAGVGFPATLAAGPTMIKGYVRTAWGMLVLGAIMLIGAFLSVQYYGMDALYI